jgi:hypothetical protein
MSDIKQLPSVAGIEKYVDAVLTFNPAIARELKGKIVEALGQAKYEERQAWIKAVVKQPSIFMKVGTPPEDIDKARTIRSVRCVEILREMGETEASDKLLKETREIKDTSQLREAIIRMV